MVVEGPEVEAEEQPATSTSDNVIRDTPALEVEPAPLSSSGPDQAAGAGNSTGTGPSVRRKKTYVSSKIITVLGYILFTVVLVANCYVIVELGLGNGG
jgi:metal iron transporter